MRLIADLRYAFRTVAHTPGFALIAILSVALGVGLNTAMFSYVDAILLRPLPVPDPGQVLRVFSTAPGTRLGALSYPDYADLRDQTTTLASLVCYDMAPMGLSPSKETAAQTTLGVLASGNFFSGLGVPISIGRAFRPEEDTTPGRDLVAVISHSLWERMFGSDPNVAGRKVRVNGAEFTIIGVVPASFSGPEPYILPDIYVPMNSFPRAIAEAKPDLLTLRGHRFLSVLGRAKPGVSESQVQAELALDAQRLNAQYPESNRDRSVAVMSFQRGRTEQDPIDATMAYMLSAITALVLLIACANVANLLLARGAARAKEIGIRMAIGGSRWHLVRQLLTESLLLALAGGVAGLGVAYVGIRALQSIPLPSDYPISLGIQMDSRLLIFSFIATIATGLLFGLMPALRATAGDLAGSIKSGDQGPVRSVWRGRLAARNVLVIAQLTFSAVLLILSAFFLRGFDAARTVRPGFRIDHTLFFSVDTSLVRYDEAKSRDFFRQLEDRLREQPGVRDVSLSETIPFDPGQQDLQKLIVDGYQSKPGEEFPAAVANSVDEHFFPLMEMPILRGRGFDARDTASSPKVAVIDDELARRMWPNRDALGQRLRLDSAGGPELQVVGVTKTEKYLYWAESPQMAVWVPFSQDHHSHMLVEVRTAGDPGEIVPTIRAQVRELDPDIPVARMMTMQAYYHDRFMLGPRILAQVVTATGFLGLVLAVIGLYGVVAYAVSRRTREIGIRMAIGARPLDVLRMVLGQGMMFTGVGIVVGTAIAIFAGGWMQAFVVGASPRDPATIFSVCVLLVLVMTGACWIPARRASRIDPVNSLRQE